MTARVNRTDLYQRRATIREIVAKVRLHPIEQRQALQALTAIEQQINGRHQRRGV